MDAEPGARIWARQQSERVERAAGRKARLAEGVRSVFMQRLGGLSLPEAFAAMDVNGDGILSIDEFKKGLRALKIGLMPWEVGEFVSVVDSDLSGSISQAEFIDMFSMPVVAVAASAPASAVATSGEEETSTAETNLLPGARLGARPGAVVDRELWERLDTLESTSAAIVDPDEYGSYSRADALDDEALVLRDRARWLTKHVCKELAKRNLSLSAAFARFDKRGTGRLTSATLLRGLRSLHIAVDSVAFDVLLLAFRTDRHAGFTVDEFRAHFEQIPEADLSGVVERRSAAKAKAKGGAEGVLERIREEDERKQQVTTRTDGLPERKRRSDGTPTTATAEQRAPQEETDSAEDAKRPAVDSGADSAIAALQDQIKVAMQENTKGDQRYGSAPDVVGPADEDESQEDEENDGSRDTATHAVACAGRRMALDLPRASAAANRARPSLLLRMPYSTLLAVSQQLPRAARVSLCTSCRELCRLLGRGPGGRWDAEASVLRRLVFDGWSTSFLDDRAMRRVRAQREEQQEIEQREKKQKNVEAESAGRESSLPSAQEPTLEDMLRQIGGTSAVREAASGEDEIDPTSEGGRIMSDASYKDLIQYLQLRQLTLAPCRDAKDAVWRRNAVRAERRVYSAAQRRAWARYTLKRSDEDQEERPRRGERRSRKKASSRWTQQQDAIHDKALPPQQQPHVVRQQFNEQTGQYEGMVEIVPRMRWYEVISAAHSELTVGELEKTAVENKMLAAALMSSEEQQQQQESNTAVAAEDVTSETKANSRMQKRQLQLQLVPDPEGASIPLSELQRQLRHKLLVENIPREALKIWLELMPPRRDPILPCVAVDLIADDEVCAYAEKLMLKRPMWLEELCRDISREAGCAAAIEFAKVFEERCLRAKEHICGICHDNFQLMDDRRSDAPCRAQGQSATMCEHEYCTGCWDKLARRSDPAAAHIPCPTCRGDVKPFLAQMYKASLQYIDVVAPAGNPDPGVNGSDVSFEIVNDAEEDMSIDGSNRSASDMDSADNSVVMEDEISIGDSASIDSVMVVDESASARGDGSTEQNVGSDTRTPAGAFKLLLVDGGPASAAGSGKWSVLCRVAAGLSPVDLVRLGASCRLFRTPLLGREPVARPDRRATLVGATPEGVNAEVNGSGLAKVEKCTRTLGCTCAQCSNSAAAALDIQEINPGIHTLPEYIAWHRVCDVLARRGGSSLRKSQRAQIEGMALLASAKPKSMSWLGLLHNGVDPWVKHVKRQIALREVKQQPRAVLRHHSGMTAYSNLSLKLLTTVREDRLYDRCSALETLLCAAGNAVKLEGDRLMRNGNYAGAEEAYNRAQQAATRKLCGHSKHARPGGSASSLAFSRVAIV